MRRVRKARVLLIVITVLAVLAWLDRTGYLRERTDDWTRYHGRTFTVTRVIDGDTLDVAAPDAGRPTTRVRLWGVDAPEMARRDTEKPAEYWAQQATDRARDLADRQRVTLRLQRHRMRGDFGRVLAYVVLPDGRVLNEVLIEEGHVRAEPRYHHDHMDRYLALQRQAKAQRAGTWQR